MINKKNNDLSAEARGFLENDAFIALVKVINDPDLGSSEIRKIVRLGRVERCTVIDRMIQGMKKDGVDTEMIEAVELLKDDKVVEILRNEFIE